MWRLNLIAALAIVTALAVGASAADLRLPPPEVTQTKPCEPNEAQLLSDRHYWNRAHEWVHSPATSKTGEVPDCAVAQCGDGAYSFIHNDQRACSWHHGIVRRLN
ncbi:MAG: DUF3761 domain-containing protein [Xanthobacteraceae bacterium]